MSVNDTEGGAKKARTEILRLVPFLTEVPEEELEALWERSIVRKFSAGQKIISQDDFGHSMYIVLSGSVSICKRAENGARVPLATLEQAGKFFGEFALLGRGQRSATASAIQESELLEIEKRRFDILCRRHAEVLQKLETVYHQRAITTYMGAHAFIGQLPPAELAKLTERATMQKFARNDLVCRTGDRADRIMLVKDGVLKAVRPKDDGGLSILAYFNTHDLIGVGDALKRGYDLVALGQVEIIYLQREQFEELETCAPEIYARFGKSSMGEETGLGNVTGVGFAAEMLKEGVEAESLLIINLDRCVRCGNCVRACHSRHDYTRLARRGPIFRRRRSQDSKKHEHILVPSSCRHCRDPECMIGCPTGAIQRYPDGDVGINDNCIGCDNCARKCPYGNISMMPIPEKEQKGGVTKKAIKCDLCRGHTYSNCVHECPRGAILRVDPLRYFDELSMVMAEEQQEHLRIKAAFSMDESKQRVKPRSTLFIFLSALFGVVSIGGMAAFYLGASEPHRGGSPRGLTFGLISTLLIGVALAYGARKKIRRVALGPLEWWTQFHMVVGIVGFVAALAHAGFQITGVLTALLLLLFGLEVLTGVLGQYIYMVVPGQLTRLERHGQAKLIEDLLEEEATLALAVEELRLSMPVKAQKYVSAITAGALQHSLRLKKNYDLGNHIEATRQAGDIDKVDARVRETIERIIRDLCTLGDLRSQIRLHRRLKNWLLVHLTTTGMLVIFLVAHIAMMLVVLGL